MSSQDKNLSDLNYISSEQCSELKLGIITSEWNSEITNRLLSGAKLALEKFGIPDKNIKCITVPGSF